MPRRKFVVDKASAKRLRVVLERAREDLHEGFPPGQGSGRFNSNTLRETADPTKSVSDLGTGLSRASTELITALSWAERELDAGRDLTDVDGSIDPSETPGWDRFYLDEILRTATSNGIESVSDAMVKAVAWQRTIGGAATSRRARWFFRGHRDVSWDLKPRIGRHFDSMGMTTSDPRSVHPEETKSLREFQSQWSTLSWVEDAERTRVSKLDADDPEWWFLKQHYDDEGVGTRMLDLTSSLLAGLYFACVKWNGTETDMIDTKTDGALVMINDGMNMLSDSYKPGKTAVEYFSARNDEIPDLVFNAPGNERSKAQSGAFLWWSHPERPIRLNPQAHLIVPGEHKPQIVAELLAFGVDPELIVRENHGKQANENLRKQLEALGV